MINKNENFLTIVLSELGVKYTTSFARKLYSEHPDKYNLLGLSSMLTTYKIKNEGYRIDESSNMLALKEPFVAHMSGGFILVTRIDNGLVFYKNTNGTHSISIESFISEWSGVVLLVYPDQMSIEPDYHRHIRQDVARSIKVAALLAAMVALFISGFYNNMGQIKYWLYFYLALDIAGIFICFLLLEKQLTHYSRIGDRICSIFSKKECNKVLDSKASSVLFGVSWSEIGFGYFFSNLLMISLYPSILGEIGNLNILVLLFSLWSIWYQKFTLKQWCPLCIIVQCLILSMALIMMLFKSIDYTFIISSYIIVISTYVSVVLLVHFSLVYVSQSKKFEYSTFELNSLKAKKDVFLLLLEQRPYIEINEYDSHIIFGDINAPYTLTVVSNPHCTPCAQMHKKIEALLLKQESSIRVQYIFTYFEEKLLDSNRILIGAYLNKKEESMLIFDKWFEYGKNDPVKFMSAYSINISERELENEIEAHRDWVKKSKIPSTPTLLVNGHLLPESYSIDDIMNIVL